MLKLVAENVATGFENAVDCLAFVLRSNEVDCSYALDQWRARQARHRITVGVGRIEPPCRIACPYLAGRYVVRNDGAAANASAIAYLAKWQYRGVDADFDVVAYLTFAANDGARCNLATLTD